MCGIAHGVGERAGLGRDVDDGGAGGLFGVGRLVLGQQCGEGGDFVANGRIGLGGVLPVNPDGVGLSSNHPGMRGIFLVIEAVKQLRGKYGDRQVANAEIALAHGTGGTIGEKHSGATLILGTDR